MPRLQGWVVLLALGAAAAGALPAGAQRAAAAASGEHEVVVNGVRLWYRVAGRAGGTPVVFLHGGPGQGSYHFAALEGPLLEPALRMVYLDQRGSGRSERPWDRAYSLDLLVRDLESLRVLLGAPRLGLIGHSFGAVLALEYARRYPARVSGVVIVSGLWDAPAQTRLRCEATRARFPREAEAAQPTEPARAADPECNWFWNLPGAQREAINNALMFPDSLVRIRLDSVQAASGQRNGGELGQALFAQGLLRYRFSDFARLTMPVLVLAGAEDHAVGSAGLRELARQLPHGRFVEVPGAGHFVYLDQPERFAREVGAFFAAVR